jgi:3-deoxy-D-manno-octulosonic-acid transferase
LRAKFIYVLYWTLQVLAFPLLLLYLLLRVARNPAYARRFSERLGFLPRPLHRTAPGAIWLHAVSVGEALTAVGLLKIIRRDLPNAPVFISCTTLAGRAMAEQKLAGLAAGVFYSPLDYRFAVRRVLRAIQPSVVIVMETEIWPNLYRDARRSGARLLVINGRISDKALPRYLRWRWFFRAVLAWPDSILAQDATATARYRMLGAANVVEAGNLKYDFNPEETAVAPPVQDLVHRLKPSALWIAASTMPPAEPGDPDEDDVVLDAYQRVSASHPRLLLILVPRRPDRFDEAARKLDARGIRYLRRSQLPSGSDDASAGVLLLDSIGELGGLFRIADVVFMGGTLVHRGGHNILEPAAFGVPVIIGPHMENFTEIAQAFRSASAVSEISRPADLAGAVLAHLNDAESRLRVGARGRELSDARRGATARAADRIREAYDDALPLPPRFNPLSRLWLAGMALDRALSSFGLDLPGKPVISVGNLSMGGSGKTPFVIWLCERLAAQGLKPAVLTRGYRRKLAEPVTVLLPGVKAPVDRTGEEAQLILRAGHAAVGIGANRRNARWHLSRQFPADVFVLDDGFQNWRTQRDLDIVLIDSIDPFRRGVFPRGLLREPFSALERAGAVVITRAEPGRAYRGLVAEIRRHNASAPVFLARTVAKPPGITSRAGVGAFCGLGQPESFRRTLRELGVEPAFFEQFPDHHHYEATDLRPLARRAEVLLTTEKDLLNIDAGLAAECRVYALAVGLEVRGEQELLALINELLLARAKPA